MVRTVGEGTTEWLRPLLLRLRRLLLRQRLRLLLLRLRLRQLLRQRRLRLRPLKRWRRSRTIWVMVRWGPSRWVPVRRSRSVR